jgi:[ribosomal protein S18]-alanine N-acetyltransferase
MKPADILAVADLHAEIYTESSKTLAFTALQLEVELQRQTSHLFVFESLQDSNPKLVGALIAWHTADEFHLLNVAVASTSRRLGVGRTLITHLIETCKAARGSGIFLEVRCDNGGAIALYRGLGFNDGRIRKRYYHDGGDALEMSRVP